MRSRAPTSHLSSARKPSDCSAKGDRLATAADGGERLFDRSATHTGSRDLGGRTGGLSQVGQLIARIVLAYAIVALKLTVCNDLVTVRVGGRHRMALSRDRFPESREQHSRNRLAVL